MDPTDMERLSGVTNPAGLEIDPEQAQSLLDGAEQFGAELGITQNPDGSFEMPDAAPDDSQAQEENRMGMAGMVAPITGGLKSTFETKDFLFGDTPRERQSAARQFVEGVDENIKQESPILGGLASGIGQFATAMIGLGKFGVLAKSIPTIGRGAVAVEGMKGGATAVEVAKAALAGAVAFDPYEERLSNLIQGTPLANPISQWLAAKPEDTAAEGRMKNALESVGLDVAIISALRVGGRVWKALKAGDQAAADKAILDFEASREAEQRAAMEAENAPGELPAGGGDDAGLGPLPEGVQSVSPEAGPMAAGLDTPSNLEAPTPPGDVPTAGVVSPEPGPSLSQAADAEPTPSMSGLPNDELDVSIVANPTAAMEQAGVAKPLKNVAEFRHDDLFGAKPPENGTGPASKPGIMDEEIYSLENAEQDWKALVNQNKWGEMFGDNSRAGPDMGSFYHRFNSDSDLLQMIDRGVVRKAEELEAKGFRVSQRDEDLVKEVEAFAALANDNPGELLGMLQKAGEEAKTLTAKMIVTGSLTAKTFRDASTLATQLRYGDWSNFGSREAMEREIASRFSMATTLLKITDEIRSQGGRTLRANRGKPFDPTKFEGLSKDRFYAMLETSKGDPSKLRYLADPDLFAKIMDTANYLRINSLISGWTTQAINVMSNGYMVGVRPLERILGSVPKAAFGSDPSRTMIKENLRQYTYMGSALMDGFKTSVKAFLENESVLRPHGTELYANQPWLVPGSQPLNAQYFRQWDSVPNLIYNALSVPLTVAGLPSRTLGGVDELMKQTVYRSKVLAKAHMDGVEAALDAGLSGSAAKEFVRAYAARKLAGAFDEAGRGLDQAAQQEASIATFQQDLLPGTFGKNVQHFVNNDKTRLTRFILPFVKTPTNVVRYALKMTPGLNLLQTEYRNMLTGKMGQEQQAQAIGQMTLGGLFMGSAAYLGQDRITGGGPSDPKAKAELMATGWRPYSFVSRDDETGEVTYYPFNRFDPIALPFGIIADIQDTLEILGDDAEERPEVQQAVGALMVSLAKQFSSRTYMLSLNQALDALTDPDRFGESFVANMAQSFVPFSSATRQFSSDPYLRDARSVTDRLMQAVPGLGATLPPRYNWLGQPVLNRQGLWTDDNGSLVDHEVQRLALLPEGSVLGPPNPVIAKGVDLRDITLSTGENAYVRLQQLAGKPGPNARTLRDQVARIIRSEAYQKAPDGDVGTKLTKLWRLDQMVDRYREAAGKRIRADKNVREALMQTMGKVADHYKHLKQAPTRPDQVSEVQEIIKGFGAGN